MRSSRKAALYSTVDAGVAHGVLVLVHSGSQLKAAAGFCFDPTACKVSASTRTGTVSSSAHSGANAGTVGMHVL